MAATKTRSKARRHGGKSPPPRATSRPPLVEALIRVHRDLETLGASHALVGGLAVSARAVPRTTRDVDIAVSVSDEQEGDRVVFALQGLGYVLAPITARPGC